MNNTNGHIDTFSAVTAIDLERQVLGSAMLDETACAQLVQHLEPAHMADTKNKHHKILATIHRLFSEGTQVNAYSVSQAGDFDHKYLITLIKEVGSTVNVIPYSLIIKERWMARAAKRLFRKGDGRIDGGDDIFDILDDTQRELSSFALGHTGETHIRHAVELALKRTADWEEGNVTDFCPTGFYSLDGVIGGYPIGELTTLAALTGAGKTSLLTQIIKTLAKVQANKDGENAKAVLLFSAEMNKEQIAHKLASNEAGIDLYDLRNKDVDPQTYRKYSVILGKLCELNLHIDDEPAPTFSHISARCQQLQAQYGLAFVGVDYDEKIDTEGDSEELRVAAIAKGLKNLAKRFMVPVVTLSQYSRNASYKEAPSDDWLRYSGKKQHESALILHWFYPAYWIKKGVQPEKIARYHECGDDAGYLICTKNRFGKTGKVKLQFQQEFTRFVDHRDPDDSWWRDIP